MDRSLRATGLFGELTEQWTRKRSGSGSTRFKLSVKASCTDWDLVFNPLNTATADRKRRFRGTRPSSMSDDRLLIAALWLLIYDNVFVLEELMKNFENIPMLFWNLVRFAVDSLFYL